MAQSVQESRLCICSSYHDCRSSCNTQLPEIPLFMYRIAGNFRGRKLSRISRFFRHPRKFSPRNSRHATPIMRPILTFRESFLREMLLSYWSVKIFSLENFPLYGMSPDLVISTDLLWWMDRQLECISVSQLIMQATSPVSCRSCSGASLSSRLEFSVV